jgi:hypothetical protein
MEDKYTIRVAETFNWVGSQINDITYQCEEIHYDGEKCNYRVVINRADYERLAASKPGISLSFNSFTRVMRPFMLGRHAADDIPEAFRLLDSDHSGTIDITELAAFMPAIVPNANPHTLLHHVQKVDKNCDYKLSLLEFTQLIKRGIGRDLVLGRT